MKCPECEGMGGGQDYWGEWDDCPLCRGTGAASADRINEYRREQAEIDAWVEATMRQPSPDAKCPPFPGSKVPQ